MYEIWADDLKIYDDELQREDLKLVDPKLTLEDNSAGSLEFSIPPTNVGWGYKPNTNPQELWVKRMTTYISLRRNGVEIWAGRVLNEKADFWNNRVLFCEGELAYFNDSYQPVAEYRNISVGDYLKALIAKHNSKVDAARKFDIDSGQTITVTGTITAIYTNYEKTIDCLGHLIEQHGGHFRIRKTGNKRYLDYLADYPHTADQTINFGENLLEFTRNWDESNFATVVIPLGASLAEPLYEGVDEKLTIATVNGGKDYLENATTVAKYGRIERVVNWDDEDNPTNLKQKGQTYLDELQFDKMTIELSALDLHYLNVNDEAIDLLDVVRVISPPHAMDMTFPVTKLDIPLDHPENAKFTLNGNAVSTLSSILLKNSAKVTEQIGTSEQNAINKSGAKATNLVNKATTGYITITRETLQNPNGTDALYITDNSNISTSTKMWKWDLSGLSYSSRTSTSAAWGSPSVAMNMDGSIVADSVKTGTLKSLNNNFNLNLNDGTLTMKKGSINIGSNAFKVDTDGSVTITKGSLSIGANDNFKVTSTGDVTIKNGNISLTQGSININDKFIVTSAGVVTITEGQINLGNNALTIDNQGNISVTKGNLNLGNGAFKVNNSGSATITAGSINIGNGAFIVTNTGAVTINNGSIDINNGTFAVTNDGRVTATNGYIGDFSIYNGWLMGDGLTIRPTGEIQFVSYEDEGETVEYLGAITPRVIGIGAGNGYFAHDEARGPVSGVWEDGDIIAWIGDDNGSAIDNLKLTYVKNAPLWDPDNPEYTKYPVANRIYFGCNIDGDNHTAYNLRMDANTSGIFGVALNGQYIVGGTKMYFMHGFGTMVEDVNAINHRGIFRGQSLGTSVSNDQKKAIWNGTFRDIYIGDYWTINGVDWQIVDIDYWYGAGSGSTYNKHHLIIMPSKNLYVAKMNATATNSTGYAGSNMYTANLADARTAVNAAFPNLVMSHQDYLSNTVDANGIITASSAYTIDVDLPSELMVYGSNVMSNRYDPLVTVSICRSQLAYFRLNPRYDNRGEYSWLKDPSGTARFCVITTSGYIAAYNASNSNPGVRPIFAMGPSSDPG